MKLDRPKTTGKRSETNHFFGHIRDIMQQLDIPESMMHHVAYAVLEMDSGGLDDWPVEEGQPLPWKVVGGTYAALAIEKAHWFADFYGLYLTERDENGQEYRVTY